MTTPTPTTPMWQTSKVVSFPLSTHGSPPKPTAPGRLAAGKQPLLPTQQSSNPKSSMRPARRSLIIAVHLPLLLLVITLVWKDVAMECNPTPSTPMQLRLQTSQDLLPVMTTPVSVLILGVPNLGPMNVSSGTCYVKLRPKCVGISMMLLHLCKMPTLKVPVPLLQLLPTLNSASMHQDQLQILLPSLLLLQLSVLL